MQTTKACPNCGTEVPSNDLIEMGDTHICAHCKDTSLQTMKEGAISDFAGDTHVAYFPVSTLKFSLMCLGTLGLYQIYWYYQNWKRVGQRSREKIRPLGRAIFSVFFCHSLLKRIERSGRKAKLEAPFSPALWSIPWILSTLTSRLPDPFWLISFLSFIFLIPAQNRANAINSAIAPEHDRNSKLSPPNIITIMIGLLFFGLSILSMFIPEAEGY